MKKMIALLIFVVLTNLTFVACTSDDETPQTTDPTTVVASMTIEAANDFDLQTGIRTASDQTAPNKNKFGPEDSCAIISVDKTEGFPKVFTVDYGNGCTIGQITRKGKLKITISAPIIQTGSVMTIERMDYFINNMKFEGTIKYENQTTNPLIPKWTRTVTNGKFTTNFGQVYTNSGFYTIQKTAGVDTPFLLTDDVYEMVEGKHVVANQDGDPLMLTVIETLVKKFSCQFVSQGKLKIEGGLLNGVIDYGNNDCDSYYTYTHENGMVFKFSM